MTVMEAIKKGFGVAAKGMGLVLVLFIFNAIWNLASIPLTPKPGQTPAAGITGIAAVFSILFILISIFIQGGALGVVRDYLKTGSMKLSGIASYGLKYYLRLLGLGLIIVLIIAIAGLIAALLVAATQPLNNMIVTIIATIIAIVVGALAIYNVYLLIMSPYALVCGDMNIIDSMKNSIKVVRSAVGKVLLLLVLLILISLGIGFILGFVTGAISAIMPANIGQIIMSIVQSILNAYLGVVMMASFMSFYLALKEKSSAA